MGGRARRVMIRVLPWGKSIKLSPPQKKKTQTTTTKNLSIKGMRAWLK
jgi:hypothetical protein